MQSHYIHYSKSPAFALSSSRITLSKTFRNYNQNNMLQDLDVYHILKDTFQRSILM